MTTIVNCKARARTQCKVRVENYIVADVLSIWWDVVDVLPFVIVESDVEKIFKRIISNIDVKVGIKLKDGKYIRWVVEDKPNGKELLEIGGIFFSNYLDIKHFFEAPYEAEITGHDSDGFGCLQKKEAHKLEGFWKLNRERYGEYVLKENQKKYPAIKEKLKKIKFIPFDQELSEDYTLECFGVALVFSLMQLNLIRPTLNHKDLVNRHTTFSYHNENGVKQNIQNKFKGDVVFDKKYERSLRGYDKNYTSADVKLFGEEFSNKDRLPDIAKKTIQAVESFCKNEWALIYEERKINIKSLAMDDFERAMKLLNKGCPVMFRKTESPHYCIAFEMQLKGNDNVKILYADPNGGTIEMDEEEIPKETRHLWWAIGDTKYLI
jgi:hypothetical protein